MRPSAGTRQPAAVFSALLSRYKAGTTQKRRREGDGDDSPADSASDSGSDDGGSALPIGAAGSSNGGLGGNQAWSDFANAKKQREREQQEQDARQRRRQQQALLESQRARQLSEHGSLGAQGGRARCSSVDETFEIRRST